MATIVSLDGALVPPEAAMVPVFDRGFLYGDSVYEVMRTYQGVPFELAAHLERLQGSATRIAMPLSLSMAGLAEETLRTHRASGNAESYLRIIVTRGSGRIGLDIALAEGPRRIVIAQDVAEMVPKPSAYQDGVEIALVGVRRNLRSALDPLAKTGNYLNSVMALAEARARGAVEAVMLDHRELVTEGASSNIFAVAGEVLMTPPLEVGLLAGVTRSIVLALARKAGIRALEVPLTEAVLKQADEVFITSSIREVMPVVRVDGALVGDGRPGRITARVRALFASHVAEYVRQAQSAR